MKQIFIFALMIIPFTAFAGTGPTSMGNITIGMSKADYISSIGIETVNCNTYKDRSGQLRRSEMKSLRPDRKTLCHGPRFDDKTGTIENINVSGLSYDVVEAQSLLLLGGASEYLNQFGNSAKAIFLNDRLISIEITFPKVGLETLVAKYSEPKLVDNREIAVCTNRIGNEFNNKVGNLDAVWVNGKVQAILRTYTSPPSTTCTDGITLQYYILEEPVQVEIIEAAINKYLESVLEDAIKENPF